MSAINIVTERGPRTFKAVKAIKGGQIVIAGDGGVEPATADAEKVLGVAVTDGGPQTAPEDNSLVVQKPEHVAVAYSGMEVYLETTAQLAFGDKVGADAEGKAKAHSAGSVVGIVTDPAPSATRALVRLA
ncbi:structural cement protein Gp24 [Corynebacterium guaraldiae]